MQEVELTAQRLLSIWWLIVWRSAVGGALLGFVVGALAGIVVGVAGHAEMGKLAGAYAGLIVWPFWSLLIVHMALRKRYRDFRVVLLASTV